MARSNADLLAIKTELATDPSALGYTGDDARDAEKINALSGGISIDRSDLSTDDLIESINHAEFISLSTADRQYLAVLLSGDSVDTRPGTEARTGLMALFGGGSATRANIVALLDRKGSRIDELFQAGTLESGASWKAGELAKARIAV